MAAIPQYTWDGLPVAQDQPHGAAVIVRRPSGLADGSEYLILHRAHHGPDYDGDWAWTPPSGSRQPGESVVGAALRELAEETGLTAALADLRAIDLSGGWVQFLLDVPQGTAVRLDAEHDRFDWLPAAEAIDRCQPAAVADGLRRAASALTAEVAFRPLDPAAAERRYGPRIAGDWPVKAHVAIIEGRDAGFLQHCRVGDYPDYAAVVGLPDAVGLDYAIGAVELTGRGIGPHLLWSYLREVVLSAHPTARHAVASPDVANVRSISALEKTGFRQAGEITVPGEPGLKQLCVLDLVRFFGERAA